MISKIIDKTEDSAVLRSAELYIDGVNQSIMRANLANKIRPKECEIQEDGNLICDGEYEIKIEATGTKPSAGILIIEDRAVKSFIDMILDIYILEMTEDGKIIVVKKLEEEKEPDNYVDSTGAVVEVPEGLTPVIYKDDNWIVANTKEQWYDYNNQEWANAIILKSGVTKEVGDIIDVTSEVQGMFVYIPRYEYKIEGQYGTHTDGTAGTQAQPGEIKVNFISKETNTASEGYHIHPAFTFGTTELNGIWVGKFEATGTDSNPTTLPDNKPIGNKSIKSMFEISQNFNNYLSSGYDAHMMKNVDWGAAAYLSQSKYGKYGNSNYSGVEKKVRLNNYYNGGLKTGYAAASQNAEKSSNAYLYDTTIGQTASTTGNITGIYDMAGGAAEYVMGVYNKNVASSEFTDSTWPDVKYYDNYTTLDFTTACNGGICYGHALSETAGWYNDSSGSFSTSQSWALRGLSYENGGYGAGIFAYTGYSAVAYPYSFRVVITQS